MSLHDTYDTGNIFAQILAGKADCYRLYEDEDCLAFLDLFPQSSGHTLVIPKRIKARNILDVDGETLGRLMLVVQKLARVLVDELKPDGVQIMQFNGSAAGQTVFHLHVHIVPRYRNGTLARHGEGRAEDAVLKSLQERLKQRLARCS